MKTDVYIKHKEMYVETEKKNTLILKRVCYLSNNPFVNSGDLTASVLYLGDFEVDYKLGKLEILTAL